MRCKVYVCVEGLGLWSNCGGSIMKEEERGKYLKANLCINRQMHRGGDKTYSSMDPRRRKRK